MSTGDCTPSAWPTARRPEQRLGHLSGTLLSGSDTRPAPQSIPFASRVRCLVALGACRRRTALGPGLLAAGPASHSILLSTEPNAGEFATRFVGQPWSTALPATAARRRADRDAYVHRQGEKARPVDVDEGRKRLSLDKRSAVRKPSRGTGIEAHCLVRNRSCECQACRLTPLPGVGR